MPDSAAIYVGVGVQKNVRILHIFRTPSSRSKVGDFGSSTLWAHCWTFFSCAIRAEPVGWSVDVEGPVSGDFLLKHGLCTVSTVLIVCASWAFEEERKILVLSAVLICLPERYHGLWMPRETPFGLSYAQVSAMFVRGHLKTWEKKRYESSLCWHGKMVGLRRIILSLSMKPLVYCVAHTHGALVTG